MDLHELDADAARWPRLPVEVWRCPSCGQGATLATRLFGQPWIACGFCRLRDHEFDVTFAVDPEDGEEAATLFELIAALDAVDETCPTMVRPPVTAPGVLMSNDSNDGGPVLLNAALRAHARGIELEAERQAREHPPAPTITDAERTAWQAARASWTDEERAIRARVERDFRAHAGFVFVIRGQLMTGWLAADQIAMGAPLSDYVRAFSGGEKRSRR